MKSFIAILGNIAKYFGIIGGIGTPIVVGTIWFTNNNKKISDSYILNAKQDSLINIVIKGQDRMLEKQISILEKLNILNDNGKSTLEVLKNHIKQSGQFNKQTMDVWDELCKIQYFDALSLKKNESTNLLSNDSIQLSY